MIDLQSSRSRHGRNLLLLVPCLLGHGARADEIELRLAKDSWLQCEPIVGIATLRLSNPDSDGHKADGWTNRQPLRRELRMTMYRDGEPVCTSAIFGLEFFACPQPNMGYEACIFRIPVYRVKQRNHEYWDEPGKYELGIADVRNTVESNRVPFEILPTPTGDAEAKRLFCVGEDRVGALQMILRRHGDEDVEEAFQRLVQLYPDSIYGRYARVVLALLEWKKFVEPQPPNVGDAAWAPMVQRLSEASSLLDVWNPLRGEVLLALVWADVGAGARQEARARLQNMKSLPLGSEFKAKVEKALTELAEAPP